VALAQRLITLLQLRTIYGIQASRFTIYRLWRSSRMPPPRRLGGRVVWIESEIISWIESLPPANGKKPKG
jgi:predicted DNA-binding transcriptional regulator AlpA